MGEARFVGKDVGAADDTRSRKEMQSFHGHGALPDRYYGLPIKALE